MATKKSSKPAKSTVKKEKVAKVKSEINVPTSMLKKLLAKNGCRVQPEVVEKFREMFLTWANNVSKTASDKVVSDNRKTMIVTDLE